MVKTPDYREPRFAIGLVAIRFVAVCQLILLDFPPRKLFVPVKIRRGGCEVSAGVPTAFCGIEFIKVTAGMNVVITVILALVFVVVVGLRISLSWYALGLAGIGTLPWRQCSGKLRAVGLAEKNVGVADVGGVKVGQPFWHVFVVVLVHDQPDANLVQVVLAVGLSGLFAGGLQCRQQQGGQQADDCYNNEQFDKGEAA